MLNELAKEIHENAVAHGWWDEPRNLLEIVALCHSELSEAVEEYRAGRPDEWRACTAPELSCDCMSKDGSHICTLLDELGEMEVCYDMSKKPEGVAVEMVDCIIRILDWFGKEGLDVDRIIREKHEYNKGRPYKHGKRC